MSRQDEDWVVGFSNFAGVILVISGVFQFFQGLAAVINPELFVVGPRYTYYLNVSDWGWVHLIIGIILAIVGLFIFTRAAWARVLGIIIATLSAIANFFYIPYYPIWTILIIALNITIIAALSMYDSRR